MWELVTCIYNAISKESTHFYIQFVRFYICCWVNKERKKRKERKYT